MRWQVGDEDVMYVPYNYDQWRWIKCEHGVLMQGLYVCMIGVFSDNCKKYVGVCGSVHVQACSFFPPGVHVQQMGFCKSLRILPYPKDSSFKDAFICRWRALVPLSTSESCCLWCRPLGGALWMADCGCHSLLGRRDRWTRCVARCGFRRRHPLWFCGKLGYRSSCSWCSCAASCAKPGIRRCRAIRWPLWQG